MRSLGTRHGAARRRLVLALLLVSTCGCAYFNTFYNAKRFYKKAESDRVQQFAGKGSDDYQKCIDKCLLLLKYYPKSKYVDDALFLIGNSHLYRGEYVQARASYEDLLGRFPKSEFAERAWFHMGLAALQQGDAAGSSQAFQELSRHFPESKLNVEAVFRTAEAELDRHDYETAREKLRAFMREHPDSRLASEAQMHLARTYYDEKRYNEALQEYARVLEQKIEPDVRYEAELSSALALRAQAEDILSNPALRKRVARKLRRPVREPAVSPQPEGEMPPPQFNPGGEYQAPVDTMPNFEDAEMDTAAMNEIQASESESDLADPEPEDPAREAAAEQALADSLARAEAQKDTTSAAAFDSTAIAVQDSAASRPLTPAEQELQHRADEMLSQAAQRLTALRKPAAKLGFQTQLAIELAVTRSLRGEPDDAISELDRIARLQPRTETSARAHYEIAEIDRRYNDLDAARKSYDQSLKEKRDAPVSDLAQKKSAAIVARNGAVERLKEGQKAASSSAKEPAPADSVEARIARQSKLEMQASELLHIAEIDLLELDQPLVALREFEQVLRDYPGSLQGPRAAFAMAWIYDHKLRDPERARQAYETVARDYADTPQGREARAILEGKEHGAEVRPSTQP